MRFSRLTIGNVVSLLVRQFGEGWKGMPKSFPSNVTRWRRLAHWNVHGVWDKACRLLVHKLDRHGRVDWAQSFADGTFASAQERGGCVGMTRHVKGTKLMVLTDGNGLSLSIDNESARPVWVACGTIQDTTKEHHSRVRQEGFLAMEWRNWEAERRRIMEGPTSDEAIPGIGTVRFYVTCNGNSESVLQLARSVMETIVKHCVTGWTDQIDMRSMLPASFVAACAEESTHKEEKRWLKHWQSLSDAERAAQEREAKWSLDQWLHWLEPEQRSWIWWDAESINADTIVVAVAVNEWPFPWDALAWLFRGSGAVSVEAEE